MIRVREFAEQCNCTPQNIYQHLKNYATELEGHTQQGRRGILLDEYACDFLRSVMYPKEISADTEVMEELNRLRQNLLDMGMKNAALASRLAEVEGDRDRALLEAGEHQKQLLALTAHQEEQEQALEQARQDAEAAAQRSAELEEQLRAEKAARAEAEEREQRLKSRNWFERLTRKGE